MANPLKVPCPANVWTKVATGVTSGTVVKLDSTPAKYLQTYRLTGETAPSDDTDAGILFEFDKNSAEIGHNVSIDVYVKAVTAAGAVRVDI